MRHLNQKQDLDSLRCCQKRKSLARGKSLTPELTGRGDTETIIQASRMKAALFALRLNELLDRP
jgi:hypothetical protein